MSFWVFPRIRGLKWFPSNMQKVGGVEIGWKLAHFFKKKKTMKKISWVPWLNLDTMGMGSFWYQKFWYHRTSIVLVWKFGYHSQLSFIIS